MLAAGVLPGYAALLVAVLAVLVPMTSTALVALTCAAGAIGCIVRSRRLPPLNRSPDSGSTTSPANQQFHERPVFVVSRIIVVFCGVFCISSSTGALLLGGTWSAPVAYGITAAAAALGVALSSRKRQS